MVKGKGMHDWQQTSNLLATMLNMVGKSKIDANKMNPYYSDDMISDQDKKATMDEIKRGALKINISKGS